MYTIHTSVQKEGELARSVVTNIAGDLSEVWEAHASAVKTYMGVDTTARTIDRVVSLYVDIATSKEEKHPLTEVFDSCLAGTLFISGQNKADIDAGFEHGMELTKIDLPGAQSGVVQGISAAVKRIRAEAFYPDAGTVIDKAILQATKGKGERHGGDKIPFLEQPWVRLYKTHGLGFLLGQADKKYHEACGKENLEDAEREFLGAIVYLGMVLLVLEGKVK